MRLHANGSEGGNFESKSLQGSWNPCECKRGVLSPCLANEALFCRDAPSETLQEEEDDEEIRNNEEEKQPPKLVRKLNDDLCPTFVILLQAPEPLCRARWRSRSLVCDPRNRRAERSCSGSLVCDINTRVHFVTAAGLPESCGLLRN